MAPDLAAEERSNLIDGATQRINDRLNALIGNKLLSDHDANMMYGDLVSRSLESAGLIDYVSSHWHAQGATDAAAKNIIRETTLALRQKLDAGHFPVRSPEETADVFRRSARTVLPESGFRSLFGEGRGLAEERPFRADGDQADETSARAAPRQGVGREETPFTPPGAPPPDEVKRDLGGVMQLEKPGWIERARAFFRDLKDNREAEFKQGVLDNLAGLELAERGKNAGQLLETRTDCARAGAAELPQRAKSHLTGGSGARRFRLEHYWNKRRVHVTTMSLSRFSNRGQNRQTIGIADKIFRPRKSSRHKDFRG